MRRQARGSPAPLVASFVIEQLGARGDGIADGEAGRVFIRGALPGERVRARVTGREGDALRAELVDILDPSPRRIAPACRHFGRCGGCALQHLDPAAAAEAKVGRIMTALERAGLPAPSVHPVRTSPPASRRRASLALRRTGGTVLCGFNEAASTRVVDLAECPVLRPPIAALIPDLRNLATILLDPGGACDALVCEPSAGGRLDLLLEGALRLDLRAREAIAAFAEEADLARVAWRPQPGAGAEPIVIRHAPIARFAGCEVAVSAGGFLQASHEGEAAIQAQVLAWTEDPTRIADLYAGLGTLSLPLAARGAIVEAVEGDGEAVRALTNAARRAGMKLVAIERDLARSPLAPAELARFEAVVFDPPRQGAAAQARAIAASGVARVVAVSCHPESFARDARILVEGGYRLEELVPIDQFRWSAHVELVARFSRD